MSDRLREAAQAALEALESCTPGDYGTGQVIHPWFDEALCASAEEALRSALAEQPKAEPVATERGPRGDLRTAKWLDPECYEAGACQSLRFKAEPRKPLTEADISDCLPLGLADHSTLVGKRELIKFARAVEAKINGGAA